MLAGDGVAGRGLFGDEVARDGALGACGGLAAHKAAAGCGIGDAIGGSHADMYFDRFRARCAEGML
ncbi:hypothetical protein Gbth_003_050 [Gluconobacter thailandicus F149-1 = NBRC 100600]|nr:hypothetical protein NBRC3255_2117 [Gluconobacter thailandicus NBRC 3255]GAN91976.1 hypothetical protein Gbth_003_050 [Gluconobacter thailandicus F149-1 = NBRC 100600]GBR61676.1 hypothetical protein AA100600_3007 [Gluconobacter thailandicus F149-1 = NBRC 100600]GEL87722.1 hypothetical protein GTH01_20800 [Gluconobacter thailandicus F149-1 = NBRC 100600]